MLKSLISRYAMRLVKNRTTNFTNDHIQQALDSPENKKYSELIKKISLKRCYYDEMYAKDGTHYLKVGLSAIRCIEDAVNESNANEIKQVLDLPCGYGRVLRFMHQFFPGAEFTACDLNKHAVDFCEKEFGAHPVYSKVDLDTFNIGRQFDLIWCGSLATHLDAEHTESLLRFFHRHLNVGGLLVFSMHGKEMLENLRTGKYRYALDDKRIEKILSETEKTGYGYANYKRTSGYGISAATTEWINNAMNKAGNWRNYRHVETAWDNHHDIYTAVKA